MERGSVKGKKRKGLSLMIFGYFVGIGSTKIFEF